MICDEVLSAIDPYLDGELSVIDVLRMHRHLRQCERCRRVMNSEAALHALLSAEAAQDEPGASFLEQVLQRVRAEDDGVSDARSGPGRVAVLSALLTTGVIGGLLAVLLLIIPGSTGRKPLAPFAAELAAKHLLYSQGPGYPLELRTSDAVQMMAWLERRLDSSQRLPRLPRANDRLVGGRISSVADSSAAYLLYETGGQNVSLFITKLLPAVRLGAKEEKIDGVELYVSVIDGVAVAWWEDEEAGRVYAAVSTGGTRRVLNFVILCAKSGHVSRLRHPRPVPNRTSGSLG
jgi:anti-sigma factor RsiW